MTYVAWVLRTLLGLMFVVFGANYFLKFLELPLEGLPETAKSYLAVLAGSGYLAVVKVLEIVGGLMMAWKRTVPLGLVILTPIIVNILLYEVCLLGKPGVGAVLLLVAVVLIAFERRVFAPVFTGGASMKAV